MILINECVNGCSLFEDNSHRFLDASTVTHRAHTQMLAQSLRGAGVQTDTPTGSMPCAHKRDIRWHRVTHKECAQVLQGTCRTLCTQDIEHACKYTFTEHRPRTHSAHRAPLSSAQHPREAHTTWAMLTGYIHTICKTHHAHAKYMHATYSKHGTPTQHAHGTYTCDTCDPRRAPGSWCAGLIYFAHSPTYLVSIVIGLLRVPTVYKTQNKKTRKQ